MSRKEDLQKQVAVLRDELWEIEDAEKNKQFLEMVGKCFAYSNSYGGDSRWPMYQKVVLSGDDCYTVKVQLTDRGEAQFICEKLWSPNTCTLGDEISEAVYDEGVARCVAAALKIVGGTPMDSAQPGRAGGGDIDHSELNSND